MIVMINPFEVFEGQASEFLALFDATLAIFRTKPGFISARLVAAAPEQPPGERAPFTHVNIAYWASAEDYAAALADPEIRRLGGRYLKVARARPAVYEVVRDIP